MHILGIKQEIVDRHPWVPINMFHAFNEAKRIAMKRMENPRMVPLVWYREAWEEQEELVGTDPWEYGGSDRNIKITKPSDMDLARLFLAEEIAERKAS